MLLLVERLFCCAFLLGLLAAPVGAQDLGDWRTDWDQRQPGLDVSELEVNVPRDAIPAIDEPQFVTIAAARDWLGDQEPVVVLALDGQARAYPLQILTWHEIVNDRLGATAVAVTFCPLCYSAIAFDRTLDGTEHDFGVSGMLRHSDLVMYDRQTHTLWQQLSGEALVGTHVGTTLRQLPAQILSFAQFVAAHPGGQVLSRETGHQREYGRNPYVGYDDVAERPWLFRGPFDDRLPPMEKVIAVTHDGIDKAYPHSLTRRERVIHDTIGSTPVVVFHADGAVSALDRSRIARSKEVGSTGVFRPEADGQALQFRFDEGGFVDTQTGSRWDITGRAVAGPLQGQQLSPIPHGDYFSFAWFVIKPDTQLYQPD